METQPFSRINVPNNKKLVDDQDNISQIREEIYGTMSAQTSAYGGLKRKRVSKQEETIQSKSKKKLSTLKSQEKQAAPSSPRVSTSKYKGVCWNKNSRKWRTRINNDSKVELLGDFSTEVEAAKAYDRRVKQIYGAEKHRLNFPDSVGASTQYSSSSLHPERPRTISAQANLHPTATSGMQNRSTSSPNLDTLRINNRSNAVEMRQFQNQMQNQLHSRQIHSQVMQPATILPGQFSTPITRVHGQIQRPIQQERARYTTAINPYTTWQDHAAHTRNPVMTRKGAPGSFSGSSRYKGVCWNKRKQKWRARFSSKGKREFLGDWDDERKAALAYDKRVRESFQNCPERLNFPELLHQEQIQQSTWNYNQNPYNPATSHSYNIASGSHAHEQDMVHNAFQTNSPIMYPYNTSPGQEFEVPDQHQHHGHYNIGGDSIHRI
uniref:AP2/ERF domain-containing protein n=1 Tax=Aplanochytrium stocchinoi TaxID=215587 RepID=A0A7S3PF81_9STRA|mmetsp:Transcript_12253/g.15920  ORF Transcript_12253/g.15920 Transcript_12253/m.15920 type:complete len:436 (-) Transcript_12253:107-1414(-)